jgi:hypothetical protein
LNTPVLFGAKNNDGGDWVIIYSPFGISNGWENIGFPYNRGYGNDDALKLGCNIISYALTH